MASQIDGICIRKASKKDVPKIAELQQLTYGDDPSFRGLFPLQKDGKMHSKAILAAEYVLNLDFDTPAVGAVLFVAETKTKEIIACAMWSSPNSVNHLLESRAVDKALQAPVDGVNMECGLKISKAHWAMVDKYIINEKYWHLEGIFLHPDYQGFEIGSRLLAPVFDDAKASGDIIWITSCPKRRWLYKKMGCVKVGTSTIEDDKTGDNITTAYFVKYP